MPFDSVPEYNRQLLKMTEWYDVQISRTITYIFRFEGHDDDLIIPDDYCLVERSYLMSEREMKKIWNDIAEVNARHFVRGYVEIRYPSCLLPGADEF